MSIYPPNEFRVDPYDITSQQVDEFLSLIIKNSDETKINNFLQENLSILAFISVFFWTGHHGAWILPQQLIKPRVGQNKGLKPDYLFAGDNSDGVTWWILELKGANEKIWLEDQNGDFRYSNAANRGVNQLTRYIDYCTINQGAIRDVYGIDSFTEPKGILLIGRAKEFKNNEQKRNLKRRHNRNNPNLQIRTYDALINKIKDAGQINYKLPWLQKLKINLLTTQLRDLSRYNSKVSLSPYVKSKRMFEWDDSKAKTNETKHSVSFPFATRVFDDQNRLTVIDKRFNYGEVRYITLGKIEQRVYVVAYTIRGSVIRLISARKANSREVRRYDNS